uniref:Si:dkey-81h8.1 n=1 Tax=Hippocampus comes TaxID=109280 RepID=A0A3Q2YL45_HIPCM
MSTLVGMALFSGSLMILDKMLFRFAIQLVIAVLLLCLSMSVLRVHEIHFTADVALFLVVVILSGSVLIHSGRRPTLFWVSQYGTSKEIIHPEL